MACFSFILLFLFVLLLFLLYNVAPVLMYHIAPVSHVSCFLCNLFLLYPAAAESAVTCWFFFSCILLLLLLHLLKVYVGQSSSLRPIPHIAATLFNTLQKSTKTHNNVHHSTKREQQFTTLHNTLHQNKHFITMYLRHTVHRTLYSVHSVHSTLYSVQPCKQCTTLPFSTILTVAH